MKLRLLFLAALLASAPARAAEVESVPDLSVSPVVAPGTAPAPQPSLPGLDETAGLRTAPAATFPALAAPAAAAPRAQAQAQPAPEAEPAADYDTPAYLRRPAQAAAVGEKPLSERVEALRRKLSVGANIDAGSLELAYSGGARRCVFSGHTGEALADAVEDGAPRQALEVLRRYEHGASGLSQAQKAELSRVRARVARLPESPVVAGFARRLEAAEKLLSQRLYGEAAVIAAEVRDAVKSAGLTGTTTNALWLDAHRLAQRAKDQGAPAIYGRRGPLTAAEVARRAVAAGADYVGAPVRPEDTRLQCYQDCVVQQAYNHPNISAVEEQMPYFAFLRAMESFLDEPVRRDGLADSEQNRAFRELGWQREGRGEPRSSQELADRLRRYGALLTTIRWTKSKGHRDWDGDHAVLVQGAWKEGGDWTFIVIDSNSSRPQLLTFGELAVLGARRYASVEPLKPGDKRLPADARDMTDLAARTRLLVSRFYGRYGALRRAPLPTRAAAALVNSVRRPLGLEPWKPRGRVDGNLLPLAKAPAAARSANLPPEAYVILPDGRRFLNKLVLRRLGLL